MTVLGLASLLLAAAAPQGAAAASSAGPTPFEAARDGPSIMEATLARDPDVPGGYRLTLALREDAPVWIFLRSALARRDGERWRSESWKILTPGVELVRIGHHEALIATDGEDLPRTITIAFTPFDRMLVGDYQPVIDLGAGSRALFTDHFTMRPASSIAAVRQLGADWTTLPGYEGGHPLVRSALAGRPVPIEAARYVIDGPMKAGGNAQIATYLHADLPPWLSATLEADIPAILDLYADRLGPHEDGRPELLVQWAGATPGTYSLSGSVVANQIVMRLEGEGLLAASRSIAAHTRQFIAHEAAHFWLGNLVGYGRPGDAWTSEGGADLMALRASALVDPRFAEERLREAEATAWRDCLRSTAAGPIRGAPERGDSQAFYACGLLFSRVAEAAASRRGGDFFSFWRTLIDKNRDDSEVTPEDWIRHYEAIGGNPAAARAMRSIAFERGASQASLHALYAAAGLTAPAIEEPRPS